MGDTELQNVIYRQKKMRRGGFRLILLKAVFGAVKPQRVPNFLLS